MVPEIKRIETNNTAGWNSHPICREGVADKNFIRFLVRLLLEKEKKKKKLWLGTSKRVIEGHGAKAFGVIL